MVLWESMYSEWVSLPVFDDPFLKMLRFRRFFLWALLPINGNGHSIKLFLVNRLRKIIKKQESPRIFQGKKRSLHEGTPRLKYLSCKDRRAACKGLPLNMVQQCSTGFLPQILRQSVQSVDLTMCQYTGVWLGFVTRLPGIVIRNFPDVRYQTGVAWF